MEQHRALGVFRIQNRSTTNDFYFGTSDFRGKKKVQQASDKIRVLEVVTCESGSRT